MQKHMTSTVNQNKLQRGSWQPKLLEKHTSNFRVFRRSISMTSSLLRSRISCTFFNQDYRTSEVWNADIQEVIYDKFRIGQENTTSIEQTQTTHYTECIPLQKKSHTTILMFLLAQPGILKPGSTAFPSGQPKKTWQNKGTLSPQIRNSRCKCNVNIFCFPQKVFPDSSYILNVL